MSNDNTELQQHSRRLQLQQYARQEFFGQDKAQALINIVTKAAELVEYLSIQRRASELIKVITQALIGEYVINR